jgi:hypothetical protein
MSKDLLAGYTHYASVYQSPIGLIARPSSIAPIEELRLTLQGVYSACTLDRVDASLTPPMRDRPGLVWDRTISYTRDVGSVSLQIIHILGHPAVSTP